MVSASRAVLFPTVSADPEVLSSRGVGFPSKLRVNIPGSDTLRAAYERVVGYSKKITAGVHRQAAAVDASMARAVNQAPAAVKLPSTVVSALMLMGADGDTMGTGEKGTLGLIVVIGLGVAVWFGRHVDGERLMREYFNAERTTDYSEGMTRRELDDLYITAARLVDRIIKNNPGAIKQDQSITELIERWSGHSDHTAEDQLRSRSAALAIKKLSELNFTRFELSHVEQMRALLAHPGDPDICQAADDCIREVLTRLEPLVAAHQARRDQDVREVAGREAVRP